LTRKRTTRPSLVLLDADVIIDLHKFGVWDEILSSYNVIIFSIILRREAYFYEDDKDHRYPIDLEKDAGKRFTELSVTAGNLRRFADRFDSVLQAEIHDGEKEALLLVSENEEYKFCTCDGPAARALGILGLGDRGISFERLLKGAGITKGLLPKHRKDTMQRYLREGSIMRIQGRGLKKSGKP
jgi:hypothetical protein